MGLPALGAGDSDLEERDVPRGSQASMVARAMALSQRAWEAVDSLGASAPKVRRCYPVAEQDVTPIGPRGSAPTNCPLLSTTLYSGFEKEPGPWDQLFRKRIQ
jgi:hypothetical protein